MFFHPFVDMAGFLTSVYDTEWVFFVVARLLVGYFLYYYCLEVLDVFPRLSEK